MDDYQSHDAVGLAELVRLGKVSAQELLDAARARAAEVNDRLNAIVVDVEPPAVGQRGPGRSPACRSCSRTSARTSRATRPAAAAGRWHDPAARDTPRSSSAGSTPGSWSSARPTPRSSARRASPSRHLFGPARNPWDPDHTPGRLLGRRGGRGGRRHRAVRGRQRRRRLDPHPGLGVRPLRPQAGTRAGARPARAAGASRWAARRPTASSRARSATPRRCSTCSSARYAGRPLSPGPARDVVRRRGRPGPRQAPHRRLHGQRHQPEATRRGGRRGRRRPLSSSSRWATRSRGSTARRSTTTRSPRTSSPPGSSTPPTRSPRPRRSAAPTTAGSSRTPWSWPRSAGPPTPSTCVRAIESRQAHVRQLAEFHESFDLLLTPDARRLPPPKIGALDLPAAMQKAQKALVKVRGAGAAPVHARGRPADQREPRLGALHPAGQPHRPPRDERAAALDPRRPADRRAARRPARLRRPAAPPGRPARAGPAVVGQAAAAVGLGGGGSPGSHRVTTVTTPPGGRWTTEGPASACPTATRFGVSACRSWRKTRARWTRSVASTGAASSATCWPGPRWSRPPTSRWAARPAQRAGRTARRSRSSTTSTTSSTSPACRPRAWSRSRSTPTARRRSRYRGPRTVRGSRPRRR